MCRPSATACLIKSPALGGPRQAGAGGTAAQPARSALSAGRRHPLVTVLLIACAAVATGARPFAAIGQWAGEAPQDVLARLGSRTATAFAPIDLPGADVGAVHDVLAREHPAGSSWIRAVNSASCTVETVVVTWTATSGRSGTQVSVKWTR